MATHIKEQNNSRNITIQGNEKLAVENGTTEHIEEAKQAQWNKTRNGY